LNTNAIGRALVALLNQASAAARNTNNQTEANHILVRHVGENTKTEIELNDPPVIIVGALPGGIYRAAATVAA
jgi:hypothetical protein